MTCSFYFRRFARLRSRVRAGVCARVRVFVWALPPHHVALARGLVGSAHRAGPHHRAIAPVASHRVLQQDRWTQNCCSVEVRVPSGKPATTAPRPEPFAAQVQRARACFSAGRFFGSLISFTKMSKMTCSLFF
jgi:hypothetical protein